MAGEPSLQLCRQRPGSPPPSEQLESSLASCGSGSEQVGPSVGPSVNGLAEVSAGFLSRMGEWLGTPPLVGCLQTPCPTVPAQSRRALPPLNKPVHFPLLRKGFEHRPRRFEDPRSGPMNCSFSQPEVPSNIKLAGSTASGAEQLPTPSETPESWPDPSAPDLASSSCVRPPIRAIAGH
jgi:hypothetical protein